MEDSDSELKERLAKEWETRGEIRTDRFTIQRIRKERNRSHRFSCTQCSYSCISTARKAFSHVIKEHEATNEELLQFLEIFSYVLKRSRKNSKTEPIITPPAKKHKPANRGRPLLCLNIFSTHFIESCASIYFLSSKSKQTIISGGLLQLDFVSLPALLHGWAEETKRMCKINTAKILQVNPSDFVIDQIAFIYGPEGSVDQYIHADSCLTFHIGLLSLLESEATEFLDAGDHAGIEMIPKIPDFDSVGRIRNQLVYDHVKDSWSELLGNYDELDIRMKPLGPHILPPNALQLFGSNIVHRGVGCRRKEGRLMLFFTFRHVLFPRHMEDFQLHRLVMCDALHGRGSKEWQEIIQSDPQQMYHYEKVSNAVKKATNEATRNAIVQSIVSEFVFEYNQKHPSTPQNISQCSE